MCIGAVGCDAQQENAGKDGREDAVHPGILFDQSCELGLIGKRHNRAGQFLGIAGLFVAVAVVGGADICGDFGVLSP